MARQRAAITASSDAEPDHGYSRRSGKRHTLPAPSQAASARAARSAVSSPETM